VGGGGRGDDGDEDDEYNAAAAAAAAANNNNNNNNYGNDDDGAAKKARMAAISGRYEAQIKMLSRTISFVWIALARAMRRIQGKGSAKDGGLRKVFTDARQRGRLTSDVYVAVALIESTVYKDPVGAKIFERGAKLFPEDENFILEYIKYLHSRDDTTSGFLQSFYPLDFWILADNPPPQMPSSSLSSASTGSRKSRKT
jgi:cleavage stimulation factor subunit 3